MKIAQHWRLNEQRYQMNGTVDTFGNVNFPPRPEVAQRTEIRYGMLSSDMASTAEFEKKQSTEVPVRFVSVA